MPITMVLFAKTRPRLAWGLVPILLAVGLALRWVLGSLPVPLKVVGGSMEPALYGPHLAVRCRDCDFSYRVDRGAVPRDGRSVCPNCGWCQAMEGELTGGQIAQLESWKPMGVIWNTLPRWAMIAVRGLRADGHLTVKRIAGLPGERVSICQGDLAVDDRVVVKSLEDARSMAILVHDDRFRRGRTSPATTRWRPPAGPSLWRPVAAGWKWLGQPEPGAASRRGLPIRELRPDPDELTYFHSEALPLPHLRDQPQPILDNVPCNQGLSRALHPVSDVFITLTLVPPVSGQMRLRDDLHGAVWTWDWHAGSLQLSVGGIEVARRRIPHQVASAGCRLELLAGYWDRQFVWAVNGHTLLTWPVSGSVVQATAQPFSLCITSVRQVELRELQVWRDVHYTAGQASDWRAPRSLKGGEYLLLGDNSPVSRDALSDWTGGVVRLSQIVGRVTPSAGREDRAGAPATAVGSD